MPARQASVLLLAIALSTCGAGGMPAPQVSAPPRPAAAAGEKLRGMSFACGWRGGREGAYGSPQSDLSLAALAKLGVTWISVTPFGFETAPTAVRIRWAASGVPEDDANLLAVAAQAHRRGLRVMLKPHLWLGRAHAPGDVNPAGPQGWQEWFASYREFILHYAELASQGSFEAFCIGNELSSASPHGAEWRRIIADIRRRYHGPLTYGANAGEVYTVPFWRDLDWIGVSAYFPLVAERSPSVAALAAAWQPIAVKLAALARSTARPIVFTELGYRSADFAAWQQWQIEDSAPVNLDLQAAAYRAFFQAVWPQAWLKGVFWWKWFSYPDHSSPTSNQYEIENKPAAEVLRQSFTLPPAR
jgi:hypothetical protein